MEKTADAQLLYEKQVLLYLLVFRKAMEQYQVFWEKALASPQLGNHPKFQTGMEQLIQVMKTCGARFLEMPEPQDGVLDADQCLRDMGRNLEKFAESLHRLLRMMDPIERERQSQELAAQIQAIKQGYHQFVNLYERIYPGRLTQTLRSFRDGSSTVSVKE